MKNDIKVMLPYAFPFSLKNTIWQKKCGGNLERIMLEYQNHNPYIPVKLTLQDKS